MVTLPFDILIWKKNANQFSVSSNSNLFQGSSKPLFLKMSVIQSFSFDGFIIPAKNVWGCFEMTRSGQLTWWLYISDISYDYHWRIKVKVDHSNIFISSNISGGTDDDFLLCHSLCGRIMPCRWPQPKGTNSLLSHISWGCWIKDS